MTRRAVTLALFLTCGLVYGNLVIPSSRQGNHFAVRAEAAGKFFDPTGCTAYLNALASSRPGWLVAEPVSPELRAKGDGPLEGLKPDYRDRFQKSRARMPASARRLFAEEVSDAEKLKIAKQLKSIGHPLGELLEIGVALRTNGLTETDRTRLQKREREIYEDSLPDLVPPEILALARASDWYLPELRMEDGVLKGIKIHSTGMDLIGHELATVLGRERIQLDSLEIEGKGGEAVFPSELMSHPLLRGVKRLKMDGHFTQFSPLEGNAKPGYRQGDFVKLLKNEATSELKHLVVDPFSPSLQRELFSSQDQIHPGIETLTLHHELPRAHIIPTVSATATGSEKAGSTLAIQPVEQFTEYDWPFLIGKIKKQFPSLKELRLPNKNLTGPAQADLVAQAKTLGFELTIFPYEQSRRSGFE